MFTPSFKKLQILFLVVGICHVNGQAHGDEPKKELDHTFQKTVRPFLTAHCLSCHGETKQEAGVRFDKLEKFEANQQVLWTLVYTRLARGDMPPKYRNQPDSDEKMAVLKALHDQQRELRTNGTRRLNRRELNAALKHVTGLDVDFGMALPNDARVGGFDTGADGLQEAADSVGLWLDVTSRAVDAISFLDVPQGKVHKIDFGLEKDARRAIDAWKNEGLQARRPRHFSNGVGVLLEPRAVGERDSWQITVPVPRKNQGILRLRLAASVMKPKESIPNPHLWLQVGGKYIDYREIKASRAEPQKLTYDIPLADVVVQTKGVTLHLSNKVEIPYSVEGYANDERGNQKNPIPGGTGIFRPVFDRKTLPPEKQPVPYIVIHSISIEPDRVSSWPPKQWNTAAKEIRDELPSARWLLNLWMEKAWRRPVAAEEQTRFLKLYQDLRKKNFGFDDALRATFQSVLLSAPFRYQATPGHPDSKLAQLAIASRLSFMLTGAPPDQQLLQLASDGKLRDEETLDRQVDRLLANTASDGFVRPFVTQWLEMDQPITIAQDDIQKQDFRFARYLTASMREETITYLSQLIRENRPAREIIESDWTMMNDALSLHYGYEGIDGGEFRKVQMRENDPRGGGILGHAGIQSMLCWMGDNWAIYRGAWALRHILDRPPPPPPLEVPELDPNDGKNKGKPFRELLRLHQQDQRCNVCHKTIDPVGFAFQNFDLSGRWRDVEFESYNRNELDGRVAWKGVGKTRPVDVTGNLPDGEKFTSFAQFKTVLLKDYQDDLVRKVLKNLFVYGTGRIPGIDELNEIEEIMAKNRSNHYRMRDLIKAVVRSNAFLERRIEHPKSPKMGIGVQQ